MFTPGAWSAEMSDNTLNAVLAALAEPTRRNAMRLLHEHDELCVCELMAQLRATQSRMSRHMGTLKDVGLVLDRRDAQWVRYRLNPRVPASIKAVVRSVLAASSATSSSQAGRKASARKTERVSP